MITLQSITLVGFKSFCEPATFEFTGAPGLHLLTGWNEAEPDLGENAVGKTTLWDALAWALYGKTTRGVSGPSIESWGKGVSTGVEVLLEVDGKLHEVRRYRAPNEVLIDDVQVEQADIDKLLGAGYDTFMHAALMGQFSDFFFDLKPGPKLAAFSDALDLGLWERAAKAAAQDMKQAAADLTETDRELARVEGEREATSRTIAEAKEQQVSWLCKRDAALNEIEERIVDLDRDLGAVEAQLDEPMKAASALDAAIPDLERDLDELDLEERDAEKQLAAAEAGGRHGRKQVGQLHRTLDAIPRDECPACSQGIPEALHAKLCAAPRRELKAIEDETIRAEAQADALRTTLKRLGDAKMAIDARLRPMEAERRELTGTIDRHRRDRRKLKENIGKAEVQLKYLNDSTDPTADTISVAKTVRRALRAKHQTLTADQRRQETAVALSGYWKGGFKDVRLWLVDDALAELEVTVNSSLRDLGLKGWRITFDIEKPKKTGGTIKGFNVFIESPSSGGPVPWESWSGGETQRLRVAGASGLARLIRGRTGFDCNVEVWDEPTQYLSGTGVDDLLDFLADQGHADGREVWLIDHRSLDFSFASTRKIVCSKSGSSIE